MDYVLKLDEFVKNKCGGLKGREKKSSEISGRKEKKMGVADCVFNVSKKEKKKIWIWNMKKIERKGTEKKEKYKAKNEKIKIEKK